MILCCRNAARTDRSPALEPLGMCVASGYKVNKLNNLKLFPSRCGVGERRLIHPVICVSIQAPLEEGGGGRRCNCGID